MSEVVDNSIEYNPKSVQLYNNIREYAAAGYSKREIAKIVTRLHYTEFDNSSLLLCIGVKCCIDIL